jgi:enoyl-CoA hydratase
MACTVRFASENARLGQPEVKLGIIPGYGGTQRLPRLVGRGRALELLLSGEPIDAAEAWRIGLVNAVVPRRNCWITAAPGCQGAGQRSAGASAFGWKPWIPGSGCGLEEGLRFEAAAFGTHARPPKIARRHARVSGKAARRPLRESEHVESI